MIARSMAPARWRWLLLLLGAAALGYVVYAVGPPELWQGSADQLIEYLKGFGPWTAAVSILLLVLETMLPPIPAAPILVANALVFGIPGGIAISWIGGVLGAVANFWLARRFGRRWVERRVSPAHLELIDRISREKGFQILLVARMFPLTSVDILGYLAGLSSISFKRYTLASALGLLPSVTLYTWLAHDLYRAQAAQWRIGVVMLLFAGVYVLATRREAVARWLRGRRAR